MISAYTCDAKKIATSFWICRFQWVDRSANRAAHVIARTGLQQDEELLGRGGFGLGGAGD